MGSNVAFLTLQDAGVPEFWGRGFVWYFALCRFLGPAGGNMGLQVGSTLFPFLFLCLWTALSSAPLLGTTMAFSPILETGTVEAGSRAFWGGVGLNLRNCLGLACPILVKLLCHILPRLDNPIGYPPPPSKGSLVAPFLQPVISLYQFTLSVRKGNW